MREDHSLLVFGTTQNTKNTKKRHCLSPRREERQEILTQKSRASRKERKRGTVEGFRWKVEGWAKTDGTLCHKVAWVAVVVF